jgi:hypothetical protein
METVDQRPDLRSLYSPKAGRFELVTVPELPFLSITGLIEPGGSPSDSPGFETALQALYGLAYTLRFALRKRAEEPLDAPVMPLEGLWGITGGDFELARPDNWEYRLLIAVPTVVGQADVDAAIAQLRRKRGDLPDLDRLELHRFAEGLCAQVLHVGPYATEPETLAGLAPFLAGHGLLDLVGVRGGLHHEIYLGDPRRAAPDKLRTILRHPVAPAG